MAYSVQLPNRDGGIDFLARLGAALVRDGRFSLKQSRMTPKRRACLVEIPMVRLTVAATYCGNHAGPCPVGNRGPKLKIKALEFDDWIAFNGIVNDVLDRMGVYAEAWSAAPNRPMDGHGKRYWVRKDNKRRHRYDWEGSATQVQDRRCNMGTPDQFEAEAA